MIYLEIFHSRSRREIWSKEQGVPWHSGNYRVQIHSETRTWNEKNILLNAQYRYVLRTQLNHLASLTKWLSVRLRTKWFWVESSCSQLNFRFCSCLKEFLDIQATIEYGFTLKHVCDTTRTYCQIHRTDNYSEHSFFFFY